MNLDNYDKGGAYWFAYYVKNDEAVSFEKSGVENIPKEIKKFVGHKSVLKNIFKTQVYH